MGDAVGANVHTDAATPDDIPTVQTLQLETVLIPSAVYTFISSLYLPLGQFAHSFGVIVSLQNCPDVHPLS